MKIGMVLEGGAMRGMYTAGALDVMMENDILIDGIVGVSAGAVFGCNYKSKQIGRTIRYNKRFCKDKRYGSVWSFLKTGDLYEQDFCYRILPKELDIFDEKTYRDNPVKFYVTCTDVETGLPVYHECAKGDDEDLQWMLASASMPFVSKTIHIDGRQLLDGGISDSIPIQWMRTKGYEKNLVILTQPKGYIKKQPAGFMLLKQMLRKYPAIQKAMEVRHVKYNETIQSLQSLEKEGKVFIIQPSKRINVSKIESNPDKLQELYDLGREDALHKLNQIREFCIKK